MMASETAGGFFRIPALRHAPELDAQTKVPNDNRQDSLIAPALIVGPRASRGFGPPNGSEADAHGRALAAIISIDSGTRWITRFPL